MLRVVIESPLAGDFERNKRYALWCARDCANRGEAAYASHLFFPQFLDDEDPAHRAFGITAGYEWAQFADRFVFYTDLGESGGMKLAKSRWAGRNIEERKLPPDLLLAFEGGAYPGTTRGFEADLMERLKAMYADAHYGITAAADMGTKGGVADAETAREELAVLNKTFAELKALVSGAP
jgi:hypothetical protein